MFDSDQSNPVEVSGSESISVILPAHNEAHVIKETLDALIIALAESNISHEIIVVDDGSTDDTYNVVKVYAQSSDFISVISYQPNKGKGFALRQGILASKGTVVSFLDSDLDIPPYFVNNLLQALFRRNLDVVAGSKVHPESQVVVPFPRRLLSACVRLLVHFLLGLPVRDTQVGIKVYRRRVLDTIMKDQRIMGFAFDIEMLALANANGFAIGAEAVDINIRGNSSHVGFKTIMVALRDTLILSFRLKFQRTKRVE